MEKEVFYGRWYINIFIANTIKLQRDIVRVIILSIYKLLIRQIGKLLTMFLDFKIAGIIHTILIL